MKKMTSNNWTIMTNQERYHFLASNEIKVKAITGLDGSAKVGSDQCMVTRYVASVGGVNLSHPWETRAEAMEQAENSIVYWKNETEK